MTYIFVYPFRVTEFARILEISTNPLDNAGHMLYLLSVGQTFFLEFQTRHRTWKFWIQKLSEVMIFKQKHLLQSFLSLCIK